MLTLLMHSHQHNEGGGMFEDELRGVFVYVDFVVYLS
jgi:hypothetical protein